MKTKRLPDKNGKLTILVRAFLSMLIIFTFLAVINSGFSAYAQSSAKNVILMIADGWSANDIEAAKKYCQATSSCTAAPPYELWTKYFMSTYYDGAGCGYDPAQAWSDFNYVRTGCITDSAAAGTALYTGSKTQRYRVSVSTGGSRLVNIGEQARAFGMASGAVSSVEVSDGTPGAWIAHNDDRGNHYAIADEGFFGDPNTTGSPSTSGYAGGHGTTLPPTEVIIGDGRSTYVNTAIKTKLGNESGQAGKHFLVERQSGQDGGNNLLNASNSPNITKLAGLFDHFYRLADGSGYNSENPTLSESAAAALNVLNRNPNGFVLLIEGGAVDWSNHSNNLNYAVGEMIDFNDAVQTVINWIEDPSNSSSWSDTLLIVTGDHETGYLTAGPGVFPDEPLGTVNDTTIALEKIDLDTGYRASWNDINGNNRTDTGETVYWSWNSSSHTNSLIPFYVKGAGAGLFANYIVGQDPVRGDYIDNTNVFDVMNSVLSDFGAPTSVITAPVHGAILSSTSSNPYTVSGTATDNIEVQSIEVSTNGGSTWNAAACSGCPGEDVTWTYSWGLPADGSYTIRSRASDASGNIETPGTGNTLTVDRAGPSVNTTVPANGASDVAVNSDVTINFSENMDCTTVTTSTITISPAVGWTRKSCSGSQAVFGTSGQAVTTLYNITVTTGVKDAAGNPMAGNYPFSYTTGSTQACNGFISITPGQTLNGNPIDLTSIVTANNAVNLNYTVGRSCPAQSNASIITKLDTWKYNSANNGDIGTTWKNTAFDDSGWSSGSGIFGYGEAYINTLIGAPGQMSVYYRKTFTICDAGAVTALRFNATYDDGMVVYINGVQVKAVGVTGDPPAWNGGAAAHESNQTYLEFNLDAYTGSLVPGTNVIAVGIYNYNSVSSDLVFDGELVVSNSATGGVLFTGNDTQAQSVDTTGWPNGEKNLEVTGDDSTCLTPLTPATDTFIFSNYSLPSLSISDPDGIGDTVVSSNPYNITYTLNDPDNVVTAAFYYDTDNTGLNGTAITGACAAAAEGTGAACQWDTTGLMPGSYYVYGITNDGSGQVSAYSPGQITINGGAGSFVDDFTTNTLGSYTITKTWGTAGQVLYDATGKRLNMLTGDNNGVKISHNVTSSDRGSFSIDFLPYIQYPDGGRIKLRLMQDASNYYELSHSDGYGPGFIRKLIGGVEVERSSLHTKYSQNNNYRITISFSPTQTTLNAFGEILVLNANTTTIMVNKFEVEMSQQDAYIDNILYTTSDTGAPIVTAFTVPAISTSLNIPITVFTATDNLAVTGYKITTTATPPLAGDPGWSATAPATYTVGSDGTYILYPWAKDADDNVSTVFATPRTVVVDTMAPEVTATMPLDEATDMALNIDVTITFTENIDCTTVTTATITSNSPGWSLAACSGNGAAFHTGGQAGLTTYTVTVTTGVNDIAGNPLTADMQFTYMTIDTMARVWNGGAADNLASNPANWSGSIVPQNEDSVLFNGTSAKDCNWNINVMIASLNLNAGYTGVFTLNTDLSITDSLIISDGTFMTDTWNLTVGQ